MNKFLENKNEWIEIKSNDDLPKLKPLGIGQFMVSDGENIGKAMYRYREWSLGGNKNNIKKIIYWKEI